MPRFLFYLQADSFRSVRFGVVWFGLVWFGFSSFYFMAHLKYVIKINTSGKAKWPNGLQIAPVQRCHPISR